jgi:hypothetical protein
MKAILASGLVAALFMCGCADPPVWSKPGATQADFNRDSYECERDTRMAAASFGTGVVASIQAQDFMGRCMVAHGYAQRGATKGVDPDETVSCKYNLENGVVKRVSVRTCATTMGIVVGS